MSEWAKRRKRVMVDLAKVTGIKKDLGEIPGFSGLEEHPFRVVLNPNYEFDLDFLRFLVSWWGRVIAGECFAGVFIFGPQGAGKSSGPEQLLGRLGVPLVAHTAHDRLEVDDLIYHQVVIGGHSITKDGPLTRAMRDGIPFLLNEVDVVEPGQLSALNDIIEYGRVEIPTTGELIRAAPGFGMIATANTNGAGDANGEFHGTKSMNRAFMSRFLKYRKDYPDEKQEMMILEKQCPSLMKEIRERMIKYGQAIRSAHANGLSDTLSTRGLVLWGQQALCMAGVKKEGRSPVAVALEHAFLNGLPDHDRVSAVNLAKAQLGDHFS